MCDIGANISNFDFNNIDLDIKILDSGINILDLDFQIQDVDIQSLAHASMRTAT